MKKLPLGIQTFRKIVEGNHVYADKTRYIYDMIHGASCYFLSRPRRFGKSLLLDTIGEVFSGEKELFKGLWIYDSDYDFTMHPVIRLDMSNIANKTPEVLESELSFELVRRARDEGVDVGAGAPSGQFKSFIEALYKKYNQKVVVLIDEYDKPILDHLTDIKTAEANRAVIKNFYGVLKSMDRYLRLTFITGVSKFTKTSIFSELNNLYDVTMVKKYANICGIPVEDLDKYFGEHIEALSGLKYFQRVDNLHDEILAWYDGYSWDGETRVINPYGLITFFMQERFSSFWYASGSPRFLLDMIKRNPEIYANLRDYKTGEWQMDIFDVDNIQAAPLLFQTGYLTVRKVEYNVESSTNYLLRIPNREVREAFNLHILSELTEKGPAAAENAYWGMKESLRNGDLPRMLGILKSLFASIPYELHVNLEAYYHSLFYAVMSVLGFDVDAEVSVSGGRIDAVLALADKVYVMEFKYEQCAPGADDEAKRKLFDKALAEGMRQIRDKGYADRYAGSGKEVVLAAFAFLGRDDIEMATDQSEE